MGHIFPSTCLSTFISLSKKMLCTCRGPAGLTLNFSNINFKGSQEDMDTFCDTSRRSLGKMNAAMSQESKYKRSIGSHFQLRYFGIAVPSDSKLFSALPLICCRLEQAFFQHHLEDKSSETLSFYQPKAES